jgi:TPR repeat protein
MSTSNKICNDSTSSKSNDDDDVCEVNDMLENMSTVEEDNNCTNTCVNCGKVGSDITNTCNKCKSVKYCNAACKKKHRHKHKKECERRVAELHDEKLFKQPPQEEDCPICFIRMPSLMSGSVYMTCCGKVICCGCIYANLVKRNKKDSLCAFCRTPSANSDEDNIERLKKRVEAGDAEAVYSVGNHYYHGDYGFPQNYTKALKLFHQAAELGYAPAYTNVGSCYINGQGVEVDKKMAKHYYELAAMAGNEVARNNVGIHEQKAGNIDRAIKHYTIAAQGGEADCVKNIQRLFLIGRATKDDYTKALSAYQTYLGEIKSAQRDEAATADDFYKYY